MGSLLSTSSSFSFAYSSLALGSSSASSSSDSSALVCSSALSEFPSLAVVYSSVVSSYGVVKILENISQAQLDQAWVNTIEGKLYREMKNNPNLEKLIYEKYRTSLKEFAFTLGNEEAFKNTFLLPNYQPDKILYEIEEELKYVKEFKDMGCPLTENELKEVINRINSWKSKLSEHKFELILIECQASDIESVIFKTFVNSVYTLGTLHSSLSLDGTIIEWGRGPCADFLICPTMDIKRFLFAFEVKAKEGKGFVAMMGAKISGAISSILNFFSGGAYGRWAVGRANEKKIG